MNDDEKELSLRDQFAIAAMQALVSKNNIYVSYITDDVVNPKSAAKADRIATAAYKIADAMRKARLASFT
jgi:hypothetical protein